MVAEDIVAESLVKYWRLVSAGENEITEALLLTICLLYTSLSFDFYHKYTTDILQRITYPSTGGVASAPFMNIGEMQNNGYELNINFQNTTDYGFLSLIHIYLLHQLTNSTLSY